MSAAYRVVHIAFFAAFLAVTSPLEQFLGKLAAGLLRSCRFENQTAIAIVFHKFLLKA